MSGNNPDQSQSYTEASPEDIFALVGNEIRAEIIHVLGSGDELSLSDLRAQMDTEVEPSQLHYHIQQLIGHFVEKTDRGYCLRPVGTRLYRTLRSGTFDRRYDHMQVDTDFNCHYCQVPVEGVFDSGHVRLICTKCGREYVIDLLDIPLETFEDETAAFEYFSQYMVLKTLFLARGVCPSCAHPLNTEFLSLEENPGLAKLYIIRMCNLCGADWGLKVGMALLADPGLIAFCHDHDVGVFSTPYWELEFAGTDKHVTIRSTDPWEVALEVTFDGETLELVVDDDLNIIERTRRETSDKGSSSLVSAIQSNVEFTDGEEQGEDPILPDKQACLQSLRRQRWADGVTCPHCSSENTIKKGTTSRDAQRYRCQNCDRIFNDLTGTVFAEHGFTIPEMFYLVQQTDDTETATIARQLDRSYNSVLSFVHEIQNAREEDPE